jgi:hypothetical protein
MKTLVLTCALSILVPAAAASQPLPADVCATLHAVRGGGAITSNAQLGEMLNRIAWTHRAQGFGVNRKSGGNNCPSPAGLIACDILQRQSDGAAWDVFGSAGPGEPTTPSCGGAIAPITDPARPWVAPVEPNGTSAGDGGSSGGGTTTTPPVDLAPILARLDTLEAALRAELRAQTDREVAKLDELKVSLIKSVAEFKNALIQILPLILSGGGLGGLLGGIKK